MPPFPQPFVSTTSHWQATNRGPTSLWNHGRDAPLPASADIVIIGAGITGASLAYHLTREGGAGVGKTVVVLEARDVASGSTGKNGGHIAPAWYTAFASLVRSVEEGGGGCTPEQALEVIFNEQDTLALAQEIVARDKLDVDLWVGEKLEVFTSAAAAKLNDEAYGAFHAALAASPRFAGRDVGWRRISDPEEARRVSRQAHAVATNIGPAGSCHPHRLTTALMRLAINAGVQLFSWAPVLSLRHETGWVLDCGTQGVIRAGQVVAATNAWTRHLFPTEKEGASIGAHITPFRGHAALVVPPPSYAGSAALRHTYSVENGPYLMHTPHAGIVLGVYNSTAVNAGLCGWVDILGVEDDSVVVPALADWLGAYCRRAYEGWGTEGQGEGATRVWSGVLAASADLLPLIGAVRDKPGMWAAAGFHGHGMARILTCTRGLAAQMKTGDWDERLPRVFDITPERLQRARHAAAIPTFQGVGGAVSEIPRL
ncbi:uncharacterized protein COLE_04421 [Cutaneotrichosporon oleaginosum]|uniref:uncharacterized protein n=1 Tax=Cutaneotrichosporon oleaginosum TaxID=879819 RepID=UPI0013273A4C|nr:hypothetical protein COLE_04421 [Cutaneotrichosporon oleaginosum]